MCAGSGLAALGALPTIRGPIVALVAGLATLRAFLAVLGPVMLRVASLAALSTFHAVLGPIMAFIPRLAAGHALATVPVMLFATRCPTLGAFLTVL